MNLTRKEFLTGFRERRKAIRTFRVDRLRGEEEHGG